MLKFKKVAISIVMVDVNDCETWYINRCMLIKNIFAIYQVLKFLIKHLYNSRDEIKSENILNKYLIFVCGEYSENISTYC